MQKSKNTRDHPQKIDILLFDQFSNHCLANLVEPMRAANALAQIEHYEWRFLSMNGGTVVSSSGMQIAPDGALEVGRGGHLCVMPSYGFRNYLGQDIARKIKAAANRYDVVAGLDTGSWLLARAGLLDTRQATIHWDELTAFAETFPNVEARRERYIIDGDRITCSGAMAAFDLTLHLIEQTHGALLALEVAQLFMTQDSARTHRSLAGQKGHLTDAAISIMQANLEEPLLIGTIAKRLFCSQKTLEMRIKSDLNLPPKTVYKILRLTLARKLLLETTQSVSEVAGRCGYDNASAMTRAFKAQFSTTPRALRSR